MSYAEETTGFHAGAAEQASLAREWRSLTRAATIVALLTSPAFFLAMRASHVSVGPALALTAVAVLLFRGLIEVTVRKFIPWPSLLGAQQELKEEDIIARRRWWFWRGKFRRLPMWIAAIFVVLALCQLLFAISGVSAPFFNPFPGLKTIFPPDELPQFAMQFLMLPLFLLMNVVLLLGPFAFMSFRSIKSYEPGDASWGVKLDHVRGQAEAKEEISRVITLWQSGEAFEQAGGKRERGLLFLGAPGTGKTMISKAIATSFNCPFVTIPGSGFAQMFIGMDVITVQLMAWKARRLARKWGGQCIVFIDEIDAVGMRRNALGATNTPALPQSSADFNFYGPHGARTPTGDVIIENRRWRDQLFAQRDRELPPPPGLLARAASRVSAVVPGGMFGGGGQALNSLLVVMDGMNEPPAFQKWRTNKINTWLDALFVVPQRIGKVKLRLPPAKPRKEEIHFIGACNVPIDALDPALTRPGRMGRHIWFRTPTKHDRKDIFDLYLSKVAHEPDMDTDHGRDELARVTSGYSPSMIEQACSMALTIAHAEGRPVFARRDILDAMTTVESGTATNIEYIDQETRAVAIHEAGHAATGHVYMGSEYDSVRLSIKMRGSSLGHYQSMEKDERFSQFRSSVVGELIMTLGAMASEHVFYGENSQGVSGDLMSATNTAAAMVGIWGMGPDPVAIDARPQEDKSTAQLASALRSSPRARLGTGLLSGGSSNGHSDNGKELEEQRRGVEDRLARIGSQIMNRVSGDSPMQSNPVADILRSEDKRRSAAILLGQAYVTAYCLIVSNKDKIEKIAETLMAEKEIYGDDVTNLLSSVGLKRPEINLADDSTWPKI
ncbi:MAG: AAA family ATPase [Solirubrobacterales bacterium]|nr:AAA family ATPase [Solirubrobacterales bacterium]